MGSNWTPDEIRAQLDDLGAFRRETESERLKAERALAEAKEAVRNSLVNAHSLSDQFANLEREIDERLAKISRSTSLWSHRAAQAGIPEEEVLDRLELANGPAPPPEDWEFEI